MFGNGGVKDWIQVLKVGKKMRFKRLLRCVKSVGFLLAMHSTQLDDALDFLGHCIGIHFIKDNERRMAVKIFRPDLKVYDKDSSYEKIPMFQATCEMVIVMFKPYWQKITFDAIQKAVAYNMELEICAMRQGEVVLSSVLVCGFSIDNDLFDRFKHMGIITEQMSAGVFASLVAIP